MTDWGKFRQRVGPASCDGIPTEHQSLDPPMGDSVVVVRELHGHFYSNYMSDTRHAAAMAAPFELAEYLLNRPEVQVILQVL